MDTILMSQAEMMHQATGMDLNTCLDHLKEWRKRFGDIVMEEMVHQLPKSVSFGPNEIVGVFSRAIEATDTLRESLAALNTEPPKQKNRMGFLDGLSYKGSKHQNQRFSQHFKK